MRYSARRALDSMSPTTASRQPSPSATLTGARSPSPKAGGHKKRGSSSPVYKQTPNKSFHARITSALNARLAGSRIYGLFVRQSGGSPAVKERSGKHRHPEPRSPYRRIRQAHPPASHASSGSPAREKPAGSAPNGTLVWQDVDHQSDSASDGDQFVPLTPYSVDLNDQVSHALNSGCPTSTELSDANADIMGHKLETIIQMLQRQQQGEYDMAATFERVLRKRFHKIQPVFKPIFFAAAQGILTTQHVCALVEGTEYAGSTSDARMRMQTLLSKDLDTTAAEQAYAKVFIHPQVWFAAWGILMVLVEQLSGPEPLLRALERTLEYVTKQSKAYQWSAVVAYMARFHNLKTVITNGRIVPEHWYHDDDFLEASYLTPKRRLKDIGFFEQQVRSTKRSHTRIGREIAPCIEWNRSKDECWTGTACRSAMDHVCSKCGNRNHRAFEHNDRVSPSDQDREGVAGM